MKVARKKTAKQQDSCPSTPNKSKADLAQEASKAIAVVSPSPKKTPSSARSKLEGAKSPARKLVFDREDSAAETEDPKRIQVPSNATAVYRVVSKATGTLGGNGYNGAIYGELTIGSMQKVINVLKEKCGLSKRSRFIDVGAGLGKPNFHAAQDPQVRVSLGIELEDIRWQLSMQNLTFVLKAAQKQPKKPVSDVPTVTPVTERAPRKTSKQKPATSVTADLEEEPANPAVASDVSAAPALPIHTAVNFICNDIDEARSLDPFTHIYMYDLGFPPPLQASIAKKFNTSVHARYLVSYRPPRRVIDEYGYNVRHIHSLNTTMFGSGENHMAYFYERILNGDCAPAAADASKEKTKITLPARQPGIVPSAGDEGEEQDEEVHCDPLFRESVLLAVGSSEGLLAHAHQVTEEFMNRGRARRDRKTRQLHNV